MPEIQGGAAGGDVEQLMSPAWLQLLLWMSELLSPLYIYIFDFYLDAQMIPS